MMEILADYHVLWAAFFILLQCILILILLVQRRREKREMKALRASERMYRQLTENAKDLITQHAADGRIRYASPACRDVFGYAPDEVLEQAADPSIHPNADPFIHPDDVGNSWDVIRKAAASGHEGYNVQHRIRHKKGHWIWVETRGRLLYDSHGDLAEIHCLTRDITDRKHAEDMLKANEEKFRALFKLVPVGISVSSLQEGRFLEINEAFLRALGYRRDEVIGKTSPELNLWTDPAGRAQFLEPLKQRGSVRDLEIDVRTKSGVVLKTLFSSEIVEIDGQQCLISAFMDITERKRNEEALRESETKFRTIFENAPLSMSINRIHDGVYLDVNRKFVESTGFSKSEILGKKPSDGFMHTLEESDSVPLTQVSQSQDRRRNKYYLYRSDLEAMEQEYQVRGKLENFYFRSHIGNGDTIHNLMSGYPLVLQGEACTLTIITDISELKKAEEELREREEKYHVLFENMAQGVMYRRADGQIDEVNPAALDIFGASSDEFIEYGSLHGSGWDVIREDGSELPTDEWPARVALTTGKPVRNVTVGVFNRQKQAYVWVSITAIPQFKPGETQPYRMFTTFHDVTALKQVEQELRTYQEQLEALVEERTVELQHEIETRKRIEESLRESEAQYRLIAENASDIIWTSDNAGKFTYISPSVQPLSGFTQEEAMQLSYEQIMTPESWQQVSDLLSRTDADEQGAMRFEVEQIRKDGSTYWTDVVVKRFYNAAGEHTGSLGITRDISSRKQSEDALRKSRELLNDVQKISHIGGWEYDLATGESFWTDEVFQIHDLPVEKPSEVLQKKIDESITCYLPEDRPVVLALFQKAVNEGRSYDHEFRFKSYQDKVKWIRTMGRPVFEDGKIVRVIGTIIDITEQKHTETLLHQAKEEAEAANRAKSIFLSSMSHELRTPLNAILGFAQLLARETTLPPLQREYLGTINRSGEHLLQLINDVLDMSKIEAGRMTVTREHFDLRQMLANVEEMIKGRTQQRGLQFHVEYPAELPGNIITDESKLRQVLINLLGNAVKFTEQGRIVLTARKCQETMSGEEERSSKSSTVTLQFSIADTGPGIAPDDLPAIFHAFHQTSGTQNKEGTGLGLALSRKFAQLLGGDIQVESVLGQGSCFTATIQVELAERDGTESPPSKRTISGLVSSHPPIRILVVDDHNESRQLLNVLLGKIGFDVEEASNGREALTLAKQWRPQLILMDMVMPVMDGYEATRKIREWEERHQKSDDRLRTPIIALTANVFEEEQQHILAAGCDAMLRKPVSQSELFELIRSYLDIQYVYVEDERASRENRRAQEHATSLTPETLAALPGDLIENLEQAVIGGNQHTIMQAIEAIRAMEADLAERIAQLAQDFKYQVIWNMIQQIKAKQEHDV